MTVSSVPPTCPRPAAVADVLARSSRWVRGTRKSDGLPFFSIPGSNGHVYLTTAEHCTCPDANERQRICKHSLAVERFQARQPEQLEDVSHEDLVDGHDLDVELAFADVARCRSCGGRTASTRESWCSACRRRLLQLDDD
jgi:hypothetical protein